VKLGEHETASTMAVALRSLASQLERYPRDRRGTGFRIAKEKREIIVTLETSEKARESLSQPFLVRGEYSYTPEHEKRF